MVLLACPGSRFVVTLRSVNRAWHQGVRRALGCSEVRRQLGCHLWDGSVACRTTRIVYTVPGSASLRLRLYHAVWSPSGDRLWCLFSAGASSGQPHHLAVFNAAAELQNDWEIPAWRCLAAVLHFLSDTQLLCLMMDDHELHVLHYETSGGLQSSRTVDISVHIPKQAAGMELPVISFDGQRAAFIVNMVEMYEEEDEPFPIAETSCRLILIDIPGARVQWSKTFMEFMTVRVVGFVAAGIIVSGDNLVGLLNERTMQLVPMLSHFDPPANEWACLSGDRLRLADGQSIFRFAEGGPPSLEKQCDLQIQDTIGTDGESAWSPDGSRIACVRGDACMGGEGKGLPLLDIFHSETGALLWRRSLGEGSHPEVTFSPDGFRIFVTRSTLGGDLCTIIAPALLTL